MLKARFLAPAFVCVSLCAQAPLLQFEVASVKPAEQPVAGQISAGVHIDGSQVHCAYVSIKDRIRAAYKVKDYQIQAPDFTSSDRFGLKLHRETKEFPVYGLVIAKAGLKMQGTPADTDVSNVNVTATATPGGTTVDLGKGSSFTVGDHSLEARKLNMANLADMLSRFEDFPVIDMTGTTDLFDFTLEIKPEEFLAMKIRSAVIAGATLPPQALKLLDGASDDSLQLALGSLGLKLDRRKAPIEVLVVDHVAKDPAAN